MPVHLIFLFLFQSGLAFAFTYFIARLVVSGDEPEARQRILRGLRIVRRIVMGFAVVLPPILFFAYYQSLPEGAAASIAVWPAAWILMILAAVLLALLLAGRPLKSARP